MWTLVARLLVAEYARDHVDTAAVDPDTQQYDTWSLFEFLLFAFSIVRKFILWSKFPSVVSSPVLMLFGTQVLITSLIVSSYRRMEQICVTLSMAMKHGMIT